MYHCIMQTSRVLCVLLCHADYSEPPSGGGHTSGTVDTQTKSLSMASHGTKAQWPPEMAAIVAEEMIVSEKCVCVCL